MLIRYLWPPSQARLPLSRLLLLWFISAVILSGILLSNLLNGHAQQIMKARGRFLIDTTQAIRTYTQNNVNPALMDRPNDTGQPFYPQTVPSYAAQEVFQALRSHPDYESFYYKEAVLNPTNLRDKADAFETTLIQKIQQQQLPELTGYQKSNGQSFFYTAEPIAITNPSCLKCHSTPEIAPPSMVAHYGRERGFGWKLNEIVGIRIAYIPVSPIFQATSRSFLRSMAIATILLGIGTIALYWYLRRSPKPVTPKVRPSNLVS